MVDELTSKEAKLNEERENYLKKLRGQAEAREVAKERQRQAIQNRADHASSTAEQYKEKIQKGDELREQIREKMLNDFRTNSKLLQQSGEKYRRQLKWFVERELGGAPQTVADPESAGAAQTALEDEQ